MADLFGAEPEVPKPGWDEFWEAYPRHTAKQAALKAWKRLKPSPKLVEAILESLKRFKGGPWRNKWGGLVEMDFIPHPASWLNGRRWEDELKEAPDLDKIKAMRVKLGEERKAKQTATEDEIAEGRRLLQEWKAKRGQQ